MAISDPQLEELQTSKEKISWPISWATWFTEIWRCLMGWKTSYYGTMAKTWGLIAGGAEATQTVTITGSRVGDNVLITPATKTAGIIESGVVTASNTVTVYAQNTTTGNITPGAKTYKIIIYQQ